METEQRKKSEVIVATLLCYIKLAQKEKLKEPLTLSNLIKIIKRLKRERKKNSNNFLEEYLVLIEIIIDQLKDDSKELDNFALFQIKLVSFLSLWLNEFAEKQEILVNDANNILNILYKTVDAVCGLNYIGVLDKIGLLNYKGTNVKMYNPILLLKDAANIILNIHPNIFTQNLNEFIMLTKDDFMKYFNFSYPDTSNFETYPIIFNEIYNNLIIFEKMKLYKEKTRYQFFIEFKNQKQFLNNINMVLSNMHEKNLLNLEKEPDDVDFLKQKIKNLLEKNKIHKKNMENVQKELIKKKEELNVAENELNYTKNKLQNLENKYQNLEKEFSTKEEEILSLKKMNDTLSEEFEDVYKSLENSEERHANHLHRESCKRIEDYFFNTIEKTTKSKIINELDNKTNKMPKIDLIINAIEYQFPSFLSNLKKNGINIIVLLKYVNKFRKENNAEVHDWSKISQETLITTLEKYFKKDNFEFSKCLQYIFANFKYLSDYSFNPQYDIYDNLYDYFIEKEKKAQQDD